MAGDHDIAAWRQSSPQLALSLPKGRKPWVKKVEGNKPRRANPIGTEVFVHSQTIPVLPTARSTYRRPAVN
jgi:hypothetical protein